MSRYSMLLCSLFITFNIFGQSPTIKHAGSTALCVGQSIVLSVDGAAAGSTFKWRKDGVLINPPETQANYTATTTGNYDVIVTTAAINDTLTPVRVTVNPKPVSGFTFSPAEQCSNLPVNFTNGSTGTGLTHSWTFGDLNSTSKNTSALINPVHTFIGTPGNALQSFTVSLISTDNKGCKDTATAVVKTTQVPGTQLNGTGFTIYNGLPYFTICNESNSSFEFINISNTKATNTNYQIKWGDASPDFNSATFTQTLTHTYNVGKHILQFIVSGQNGCKDTTDYNVFVGSNPAVGLGNPGNTIICTGTSLTFPISSTASNPPGTVYTVTFNDGSPSIFYTHPDVPDDVTHKFDEGSCGIFSGSFSNSFSATIVASNPCATSAASVVPIYVSKKGSANFSISPNDTTCINSKVTLTNIGTNASIISSQGQCIPGKAVWQISPAAGWSTTGNLGDATAANPALWLAGDKSLDVIFTIPGVYTIKLKTGGNSSCGFDEVEKTICVNPIPVAAFTVNQASGCLPLTVTTVNNSNTPHCGNNIYKWIVSYANNSGCTPAISDYSFTNGTSASSANPQFRFNTPGVYTISLQTTSESSTCISVAATKEITVKTKPSASFSMPASICQNGSINPTATVNNCYATNPATYLWAFTGGTPATSTSAIPGSIVYNTAGTYSISLTVTNECGDTTIIKQLIVKPTPDGTVPANQSFCTGITTTAFVLASSSPGATYTWTNTNTAIGLSATGTGNIPAFTTINNGTTPLIATITVTSSLNGCDGVSKSFTITVNPKPTAPTVSPVIYCLGDAAIPLTAIAGTGNTLLWYSASTGGTGSGTVPTPATDLAGNTTYYISQINTATNCESSRSSLTVTVYPLITGNAIGNNQVLCSGGTIVPLAATSTLSGGNGSFTYQWQVSTDNGTTWSDITNATTDSYSPGILNATTKYRRIVNSGPCANNISNIVTITIQGTLTNFDIAASQTICDGEQPAILNGELPAGGSGSFIYQWESSLDNSNWTSIQNATLQNYQPPVLNITTYYKRKVTSGSCSAYSSIVTITVNPKPVMTPIASFIYCNNSPSNIISFSSLPSANVIYSWTNDNPLIGLAATGTGSLASFTTSNNNNTKVPISGNITVTPTFSNGSKDCPGTPAVFTITVLPAITINAIPDQVVCTGSIIPSYTPVHDANLVAGVSINYSWTVAGSGISLQNGSGFQVPAFNTINNGTTDLIAAITVTPKYTYNGTACDGTPVTYTITVKSATPGATAGPDTTLCAATTYAMQALASGSATGTWSQLGTTTATIADPSSPTTQINGLLPNNTYKFEWKVTGFASCPSTKDTVTIVIDPSIVNVIDDATKTICFGQSVNITGQQPTGGNGSYQYQWQTSADGSTWTDMPDQTDIDLSFSPLQNVYVRRIVISLPCTGESLPAHIIVQAPVTNNTITADQAICINTAAALLQGTIPAGADGVFQYQWQSSTNGGNTWANITGANLADYNPGVLNSTTIFRRTVSSALCSGPQSSNSNIITIKINPDAKALFIPVKDTGCAPFAIDAAIIGLQVFAENNRDYNWFADGVFIGTGTSFPGYTINNSKDSVTIKLVAVSGNGCKSDSMEHKFYTYITPVPSFTVSLTEGCGPLVVAVNNTTAEETLFTYQWDFGNGQTSAAIQPGDITFDPNPSYGDTTYLIKLKVISSCDAIEVTRSVKVKSKPRALFAPDITVGCSPMSVTFNNASPGIGNSYTWDFGDGATLNTATAESVSHTFISGIRDTFYVKLNAVNECGADSLRYAIVVSPNTIKLDFAVNGDEQTGCSPHAVRFINNSRGASNFTWNFGDGNTINTQKNIDTLSHNFLSPGTYLVTLRATNGCSDTTSTETIIVYPTPRAAFDAAVYTSCIGDSVRFTNMSDNATSYEWQFGDGAFSAEINPTHVYAIPGTYDVVLKALRFNAPGSVCADSATRQIKVVASLPGSFTASDTIGYCAPFSITFSNQNIPSLSSDWDFGDGTNGTGNTITHTFAEAGTFEVKLIVTVPGGCTYITTRTVKVLGPSGQFSYSAGYLCNDRAARFQVQANNTDTLIFNFGDGTQLKTTSNIVFHAYPNGGIYLPSVILKNKAGCEVVLPGIDSIKVDKIKAGFTTSNQQLCGSTIVSFKDTSTAFWGTASVRWNFGDGSNGTGSNINHIYTTGGTYPVEMIFTGSSGCTDTVRQSVKVVVNNKPVADIQSETIVCAGYSIPFTSSVQSADAINILHWSISNGVTNTNASFNYTFSQPGNYIVRLIAGTVNGCFDTVIQNIRVNPSPVIKGSNDLSLCLGNSTRLNATGSNQLSWSPIQGLSCVACSDPVATPLITTPYVVQGLNNFGCAGYDTVVVTVIQPLQLRISADDSICIGQSTNLLASGATSYSWSPSVGLNSTTLSNPTATPAFTTRYRVVGYDGFNCFTDTAYVLVAVGQYPTVNLGADLVLSTGTLHPLVTAIQNGPVSIWNWTPATDLSCADCPLPVATIKKDITYIVNITNNYGCSAKDTINIKVFCENTQVFIPNAFTPDNDGINDVFMVHGKGIVMVKSLRVFNRWGELVFEKSSFTPNNPANGWDGKIKGIAGGPDVFVYTAEVICENGASYNYKGNVSIIK